MQPSEFEFPSKMWRVAVAAPLKEPLAYLDPLLNTINSIDIAEAVTDVAGVLGRGSLVRVPLKNGATTGIVLGPFSPSPAELERLKDIKFKNILDVDFSYPPLPEHFLNWLEWLAQYYIFPLGLILSMVYPPLKKPTNKRQVQRKKSVIPRVASNDNVIKPLLTDEQAKCLQNIDISQGFSTHLVFGVTGSGKTEIYLRLLEQILEKNKSGIVLVPEISLTPQLINRFVSRFGDKVAVLHSQLTNRERTSQWWDVVEGRKSILIGARSALFCPIENLGIIIVDEEHESSYKQDDQLRYNARDAAIVLAKNANCCVVLGSATPSIETYKNAKENKYFLHTLEKRVSNISMPTIEVVDLRLQRHFANSKKEMSPNQDKEFGPENLPYWMSQHLHDEMALSLTRGEQCALFLNRRGMAQTVLCPACGFVVKCPNCEISLTLHGKSHLVCHYCDYHENLKNKCGDCQEGVLKPIGLGTELIEKDLIRLFPNKRIARADRDEIQNRLDMESLIERMENNEIDILIGTQMISKGLDFKNLKLVGIVLADVGFNIPDFRSTEKSFQLITQMSGRSGRHILPGENPGKVLVQCLNTQHPSVTFSQSQDYVGFTEMEIEIRRELNYPPFSRLISIRIQGPDSEQVIKASSMLFSRAETLTKKYLQYKDSIEALGPAAAPISKIRNKYRYYMLIKASHVQLGNSYVRQLIGDESWRPKNIELIVDVDPVNLI